MHQGQRTGTAGSRELKRFSRLCLLSGRGETARAFSQAEIDAFSGHGTNEGFLQADHKNQET